jgi:hypothetical protein
MPGHRQGRPLEAALSQGKSGRLAFALGQQPMGLTPDARRPPLDTSCLNKPPDWPLNLAKPEQFVWNIANSPYFSSKRPFEVRIFCPILTCFQKHSGFEPNKKILGILVWSKEVRRGGFLRLWGNGLRTGRES